VIIEDTTQLLRVDNHIKIHLSFVSWSLNSTLIDINNIASSSQILIDLFPNPASDYLNIRFSEAKGYIGYIKVEIYDTWGKKLISQKNVNPVNLQSLSQGIYIVRIYIDNELVTTSKIIKE
jgi:hypothetical protein